LGLEGKDQGRGRLEEKERERRNGRKEERTEPIMINSLSEQLPGSSETAASFALEKEDHTLGNSLRYLITKK
jgi:DNA-directed RNA polymerase I and III subunit RPAC2